MKDGLIGRLFRAPALLSFISLAFLYAICLSVASREVPCFRVGDRRCWMAYAAGYVPSITEFGVMAGKLVVRKMLVAARINRSNKPNLCQYPPDIDRWLGSIILP